MDWSFSAGDSLDFETIVDAYPASDGWEFHLRMIPFVAGAEAIELTSTDTNYRIQVGPGTTADWTPASYTLKRWVAKTGARHELTTKPEWADTATILPDPATATVYDGRSAARKALADAEAALATYRATSGLVKEFEIGNRRTVYRDVTEIYVEIDRLRADVRREDELARNASGERPRHIEYRFGRV